MKEYELVKKLMYQTATRFNKKHGNWLVKYLPHRQVMIMDTWNSRISLADAPEKSLEDNGYVDSQVAGRVHASIYDTNRYNYGRPLSKEQKIDAINMWKLFLLEDFELK